MQSEMFQIRTDAEPIATCHKCGNTKPMTEFYQVDIRVNYKICKECRKLIRNSSYAVHRDKYNRKYKTNMRANLIQRLRNFGFKNPEVQEVARILIDKSGGECPHTGIKLRINNYSIDHVVPVSRGGKSDDIDNIQLVSSTYNRMKGDMSESELNDFIDRLRSKYND